MKTRNETDDVLHELFTLARMVTFARDTALAIEATKSAQSLEVTLSVILKEIEEQGAAGNLITENFLPVSGSMH